MTACWECPIGGACPTLSRCPLPRHEHHWTDVTTLNQRWQHEMCSSCGGERVQPRDDGYWVVKA